MKCRKLAKAQYVASELPKTLFWSKTNLKHGKYCCLVSHTSIVELYLISKDDDKSFCRWQRMFEVPNT